MLACFSDYIVASGNVMTFVFHFVLLAVAVMTIRVTLTKQQCILAVFLQRIIFTDDSQKGT